ncbi:MAG: RNA 3'-terminal phosphate cyclase [Promethearchaeota archaeon]
MIERELLEIDGSFGEGGGAILRIGAGFSVLFNRPIKIKNIRSNRPKPGLRLQHLMGLKLLSDLTGSELADCEVGTKEILLNPKHYIKSNVQVKIGTAGSIGLLLQPIQIACMGINRTSKIEILINGGGSFTKWAPSLNYLREVTYKIFKRSGLKINIEIQKHGFYPKGGARILCNIIPSKKELKPINLTELGNIDLIQGEIIITKQLMRNRDNIGTRIRKSIQQQLKRNLKIETNIEFVWVDSTSPGVGLSLWAQSDTGAIISTGTILGERKIRSEDLGKLAANEITKYIKDGIPVDNFLSDQLIPLMAYVKKPSKIKVQQITSHTQTNLELVKLFTPRDYNITKENNYYIIEYP